MPSDLIEHDQSDPCAELQAQLAAYALGEIDADTDMLAHLAACPNCQRDLRAYVQVAWMLPYDAPEVGPPPALRERILAAVVESQPAAPPDLVPAAQPAPPATTRQVASPVPQRRIWRIPALWPAFAFAAVVLFALLGWNIALQNQVIAQAARLAAQRESWQTMIALLNDPAVQWYPVAGDTAKGHFWADPQNQVACLVAQGLPPLEPNQVYQVWLVRGTERTSGGVFEARNGNGWILIRSDEPMGSYDSVGVTIEPAGGSPRPTSPPVLRGALTTPHGQSSYERAGTLRLLMQIAQS